MNTNVLVCEKASPNPSEIIKAIRKGYAAMAADGIDVTKESCLLSYGTVMALVEGAEAAQPKWISVEDELPPVGEKVLACANNVRLMAFIDCGDVWHRDTITFRLPGTVTHWMPLPEPPKEEA